MKKYISMVGGLYMLSTLAACNNDAPQNESINTAQVVDENDKGKALFQMNCANCHNPLRDATGPALNGALARWNNDTARLKAYIRNPAGMISSKDPRALAIFEAYKPAVMTAFPNLSDEALNSLIAYFEKPIQAIS